MDVREKTASERHSKTRKAYGYKWTWDGERKEGDD